MDRHDVSEEVTAEIVADLHQKDLAIQHKFNCRGLTYWFDDKRKTAFCLVEAPNKAALKKMHDEAHGEVANRIIEVDGALVESFLGRIEDPEKSLKTELNIINDPAFRTIMIIGVKSSSLNVRWEEVALHHSSFLKTINIHKGRPVKQNQEYLLVSFESVTNAVLCSLEINTSFKHHSSEGIFNNLYLKIGISAGVPVDEKDGFFEDTIKKALSFFDLVKGTVVLSSEVKELYESENLNTSFISDSVIALNHFQEKFLNNLVDYTLVQWSNSYLTTADFCRSLGFSRSQFYRKIIALTGKSPNSFLKEYRLKRALDLLNTRKKNISEIAFETGFNSPAYFSKCFKESFRILPSQYIKA
jgi:AraC-like DNA-binding protein